MAHGFSKEKLKTVESQLSDASQEQDPTCNGMARHGCVFGRCTDDVQRLLEEFAAYTLAIAKAEVGGMQIRMLYNCVLVSHKFLGILWEPLCLGHAEAKTPQLGAKASRRTGRTELHNAVCSGDEDYVQQLLKNRASVDAMDGSGRTPLHLAASELSEPVKIIELLLEARARTEAEDLSGPEPSFTPLNLACDSKCKEAVAVLQSAAP
ncbi:unnamed protein product [Cladocopium goreaui]|uniref:Uncharacterized protein n=1 Tax=Cladocopium goreaui TaxID=2562237 RepID=A0A9P1FFV4_9DINO|nr:unnamed protein product [Cladocopium goreaui]